MRLKTHLSYKENVQRISNSILCYVVILKRMLTFYSNLLIKKKANALTSILTNNLNAFYICIVKTNKANALMSILTNTLKSRNVVSSTGYVYLDVSSTNTNIHTHTYMVNQIQSFEILFFKDSSERVDDDNRFLSA